MKSVRTRRALFLAIVVVAISLVMAAPALATGTGLAPVAPYSPTPGLQTGAPPVNGMPATLWDQTAGTFAYASEWPDAALGVGPLFCADDFDNASIWRINRIDIPVKMQFGSPAAATSLTWQIYADANGEPAGRPTSTLVAPYTTLTLAPSDSQVAITGTFPYYECTVSLAAPIILSPGHWWLVFYQTTSASWGWWRTSPDNHDDMGVWCDPTGSWGIGSTWHSWTNVAPGSQTDLAFTLSGDSSLAPRVIKTWVLDNLEGARSAATVKKQRQALTSAIASLTSSLSSRYWQSDTVLTERFGSYVFPYEHRAVTTLLASGVLDPTLTVPLADALAVADRELARLAISAATSAGGKRWLLNLATSAFQRGNTWLALKTREAAIDAYGVAWKNAVASY